MNRAQKKDLIKSYQKHDKDTGSPQVQIMILTERILEVTRHLDTHKKDNHSRRGLLKMVENRKKLLNYIKFSKPGEYEAVVERMEKMKSEAEKVKVEAMENTAQGKLKKKLASKVKAKAEKAETDSKTKKISSKKPKSKK